MPGFLSALADLLGIPPIPGTSHHRDTLHRCMRERNEELAKPPEQRDAARLLELTKLVLRMRSESAQWALICSLRLEALEQGHPKPPLVLPHLDVQPYLAEGVPAELPASSIDRCAACQKELEQNLFQERLLSAQVDYDP